MFCHNCGTALEDGAKFCSNCGTQVAAPVESVIPEAPEFPEAPVLVQDVVANEAPVEAPVYAQPVAPTYRAPEAPVVNTASSANSTPILIFGIIGLALSCSFYLSLLGIIFSAIGKGKVKAFLAEGGQLTGKAKVGNILAKVGLILGIVLTVFFVIWLIIVIVAAVRGASSYSSYYYY